MNKKISALILVGLLGLFSGFQLADSQSSAMDLKYLPELTIKSDGTIAVCQVPPSNEETPDSDLIIRDGNTYTLTADIDNYSVRIDCSNIIFDGAGHTINASGVYANSGLRLLQVNNVIAKNLQVIGTSPTSIFLAASNCSIINIKTEKDLRVNSDSGSNIITESNVDGLILWRGSNIISKCNISRIFIMDWSSSNLFFANNILRCNNSDVKFIEIFSANFWDNGSVGNYWFDYQTKYANASEKTNTGVGDTSYILDKNNIDHHPLIYPYDIEKNTITTSNPTNKPENPLTTTSLIIVSILISAVGAIIGFFYYYRKTGLNK
ncbi:MAG: hypothetical protein ACQCN4_05670 [Candidatus Bathyarchaeia archaeon]